MSVWVIPNKLLLEGWDPGIMAEYRQCPVGNMAAHSRTSITALLQSDPVKDNLRLQLTVGKNGPHGQMREVGLGYNAGLTDLAVVPKGHGN